MESRMKSIDPMPQSLPRRNVLTYLASATGFFGLNAVAEAASKSTASPTVPPAPPRSYHLELTQVRDEKTRRSSSWDRHGGDADFVHLPAGQTITILDTEGPGVISHLWFTLETSDPDHLKTHVLRAFWDGENTPSVEVPLGDFFGLGLGEYFLFQSAMIQVAPLKALNAYFPMPFRKSARLTVTNEGLMETHSFYYNLDYSLGASLPDDVAYFHAQYRQQTPTHGVINDWRAHFHKTVDHVMNLDGAENYVFLEASGQGHLIGVSHAILQNQDGWIGEGDDMIFIDGDTKPTINGTGTEDYYGGAWNFGSRIGGTPFSYPYFGAPLIQNTELAGGRIVMYRFHIDNPVRFQKSIKMTMEHGHANSRSDNYYTVAYWYQIEPHAPFPVLPPAAYRIPHLYRVDGPGALEIPSESHPPPPLTAPPIVPSPSSVTNPSPTTINPPPK